MSQRSRDAFDEEDAILRIRQYDDEINQLEEQLEIRRGERSRLQTQLDLFRASIAPIKRLSEDILVVVFSEVILGFPMAVGRLLFVCRAWYQLVTNQPTLWSRISSAPDGDSKRLKQSTNYVNSAVRYSVNAPLDIELNLWSIGASYFWTHTAEALIAMNNNVGGGDDNANWYGDVLDWAEAETAASTFPLVVSHASLLKQHLESLTGKEGEVTSRWRSFSISFAPERFAAINVLPLTFLHHSSPLLERLVMELPWQSTPQYLTTFLAHTPRLRTVCWSSNPNVNAATLISCKSQIINLQIRHIAPTDNLLYTTLFENIQTMHLDFKFSRHHIPADSDFIPLCLHYPQLQELTVVGRLSRSFIDGLNAPRLHKLCLLHPESPSKVLDSSPRIPHLRTLFLHANVPDIVGVCERFMARFKSFKISLCCTTWNKCL